MPIEHRQPYPSAVKTLYANAYRCAYPACKRPLYKVDPETAERSLNSNVAHICARSEGGPRWDGDMSEEQNRSTSNLLILCLEHALEIDNRAPAFSVELLQSWKQKQLDEFDALGRQGWMITTEMADDALRASEKGPSIIDSVLNLGGTGGNGPGAGGGGGGAFGANAHGGPGGAGGHTKFEGVSKDEFFFLGQKLPSGQYPGAGGGGAGAVDENATGGGGGGGGDIVTTIISAEEFAASVGPIKIVVGEGGAPGEHPGEHSEDGGDSGFQLVAADGRVIRSIMAKGGVRGILGFSIPSEAREVTSAEIDAGINITTLMVADAFHTKNGLLYVMGGAVEYVLYPKLPADIILPTTVVGSLGRVSESLLLTFYIVVENPIGSEILRLPFNVAKGVERPVANFTYSLAVQFKAKLAGVWVVRVLSGDYEFARLSVEIRSEGA